MLVIDMIKKVLLLVGFIIILSGAMLSRYGEIMNAISYSMLRLYKRFIIPDRLGNIFILVGAISAFAGMIVMIIVSKTICLSDSTFEDTKK